MVGAEVERVRRLMDGLRRDRRTHPLQGRREYSRLVREVATECEALLACEPGAVPALTRRAVERISTALMYMDDSSGIVGNDLRMMTDTHARGLRGPRRPTPSGSPRGWPRSEIDGPGWPDFELRDFATALGEKGRAELARIVDNRATTAEPDVFGRQPFAIRILREQLAEISGDVDRYVAVVAEDLRVAAQYLKIVHALRDVGRAADAEDWARRGLAGLGNPIDMDKLREAYVDLLLDRGANGEAIGLRQRLFTNHPSQSRYVELRRTAERAGDCNELRDEAIRHLRGAMSERPPSPTT